jgi:Holliday junction resolvase
LTNSRNKGLRFELQVSSLLYDELGIKLHRDLEQTRTADHGDLISSDPSWPFCIECKRYAKGYFPKDEWWEQVCTASDLVRKIPILVYKFDRLPIRVRVPIAFVQLEKTYDKRYVADLDFPTFCYLAREIL